MSKTKIPDTLHHEATAFTSPTAKVFDAEEGQHPFFLMRLAEARDLPRFARTVEKAMKVVALGGFTPSKEAFFTVGALVTEEEGRRIVMERDGALLGEGSVVAFVIFSGMAEKVAEVSAVTNALYAMAFASPQVSPFAPSEE